MDSVYGYSGRFLRVDLGSQRISTEKTPDPRKWLGPRGWNILFGWRKVPPEAGPFDDDNRIVFSVGPLVGTGAPTAGRTTVSSLSPRGYPSPMWVSASMGGYWGAELKYAGYDGIIIEGTAANPCYLLVEDGDISLEDARDLWGKGTFFTQQCLKERHGSQHQIIAIGPAGENRVRFASIIHRLSNAVGNGGLGGVMGSKKIKAIAIRGTGSVAIARPREFLKTVSHVWHLARGGVACIGQPDEGYPFVACTHGCSVRCGTRIATPPGKFATGADLRMLKCQNGAFMRGSHPGYEAVSIRGQELNIPKPPGLGEEGLDLGNMIDDMGLTAWFYDSWYRYLGGLKKLGIRKLLDEKIELENPAWWYEIIRKVAYRDGIGTEMAEGVIRFHDKHEIGARYLAEFIESEGSRGHGWHRDGRAMEPHPSPFWQHSALLYATSTRDVTPSTHGFFFLNREYGYPTIPKNPDEINLELQNLAERVYGSRESVHPNGNYIEHVTVWHQHRAIIKDSLGICDWVFPILRRTHDNVDALREARQSGLEGIYGDPSAEARLYNSCTGIDMSIAEMESPVAERIFNLERCLDIRNSGRNRKIDETVIPHFQWPEKTDSTHISSKADEFRTLLDRYYDLRGWNKYTGIPKLEKLAELGLDDIIEHVSFI